MNLNRIKAGIEEVWKSFHNILHESAERVIEDAVAELSITKKRYDQWQRRTHHPTAAPQSWGYRIHPQSPLRFVNSSDMSQDCWVDLFCNVQWQEEGAPPIKQELVIRLWTEDTDLLYRSEWDAEEIEEKLTGSRFGARRVVSRFHFDLANPGQTGPRYHVQFGGNAAAEELFWFPRTIKLPRLAFPPMDIILASELIVSNFYSSAHSQYAGTGEWIGTLRRSQNYLLLEYYRGCLEAIQAGKTLTGHIWNN